MFQERRRVARVHVKVYGNYVPRPGVESWRRSCIIFTRDITAGGARVIVPERLQAGRSLVLDLELPTCFLPISVTGRIVWASSLGSSDGQAVLTEAGISFDKMSPYDGRKLADFVDSLVQSGQVESHNQV